VYSYKIAAYITVYKDVEAARNCLKAIKEQSYLVSRVFVLDNSPTSLLNCHDDLMVFNHYPSNIGVGKGLALAMEWAIEQGYDFLWAFDQDSIPSQNCLEILLTTYQQLFQDDYRIGIVAPTPIDTRTNQIILGARFNRDHFIGCEPASLTHPYECDAPITSGSLINLTVAKTISPPRADLFIDGIDLDYGMRIKNQCFHNLIVPQAILHHNFGNPLTVNFWGQQKIIQNYSALRHYYICRNHTYLARHYAQGKYRFSSYLRRIKYMLSTIVLILLYDHEDKYQKIWACLQGTFHGLTSYLGKHAISSHTNH
jgi:rhamnosyltransferase